MLLNINWIIYQTHIVFILALVVIMLSISGNIFIRLKMILEATRRGDMSR